MSAPDATKPVGAGTVLSNRYRLVRLVAHGGMASVWEAHDSVLARSVAVKMLHPHLAEDKLFRERFRREAVSAARLAHPNVVATFDAGVTPEGTAFIVMELIRGQTLSDFAAAHRPLPIFVCVEIGMQVADALAQAHAAGLIHRDVKPGNVLVCDNESDGVPLVKVTDFGIAKAAEGLGLELTKTGMVLGTPKYLCPEQIEGREPDARGDLYSLGVVLFELITGVPPFRGPNEMAVAVQHLNDMPPRLRDLRPNVPPALDDLVAQLLAKRPQDRPSSAAAVRQSLAAIDTRGRPDPGRGPTVASPRPVAPARTPARSPTRPPYDPSGGMPPGTRAPRGRSAPGGGPAPAPPLGPPSGSRSAGPARPPAPRRPNWTGRLVAGLVILALVVVVVVVIATSSSNRSRGSSPPASDGAITTIRFQNAAVFHLERDADDAVHAGYAIDGNPGTAWQTDRYFSSNFAKLRHGLGLALTLDSAQTLHHLVVQSSTIGWSAEVYVANAVPNPASLAPWGSPVDSKQNINGNTTFDLHGNKGSAVLLWITDLGPSFQTLIAEVSAN